MVYDRPEVIAPICPAIEHFLPAFACQCPGSSIALEIASMPLQWYRWPYI
jgi:hypothetical protein